jgi:hypothetical protein
MPAVKSVPIKDPDSGAILGQRFEASNTFLASLHGSGDRRGNYVPMKRPDGKVVNVNRKLAAGGYYDDKGYEPAKPKEGAGK